MKPQILIAGAGAGSGKTLLAMGLLRALKKRGLKVQPFKCGPDYMDAQLHALAAERDSINLDTWMATPVHVQSIYNSYAEKADVCVTEGMTGLFDGYNRMQGSTAELSQLLNIPVVLVVNARSASYSVAPLIYGFKHFRPSVRLIGVVFSQVSSVGHYACLSMACKDAGVECLGYLPSSDEWRMPSRHAGLTLAAKQQLEEVIGQLALQAEQTVSIDKLLSLSTRIFPCRYALPYTSESGVESIRRQSQKLRIAVAKDAAFPFACRENLDRLSELGKIAYFSPVYGSDLPEADLIYLPGGYPELFARQLHRRKRMLQQLREYAEGGGKLLAECGGMVLLARSLTAKKEGTAYEMAGVLPIDCTMEHSRLQTGYRRMEYNGVEWKGHEFHYTMVSRSDAIPSVAQLYNAKGAAVGTPVYRYKNVIASYVRWYWGETNLLGLWEERR